MDTQYWNKLAHRYETKVMEIARRDINHVLIQEIRAADSKNACAADLGCGPGGLLPLLSPHFKHVFAVDFAVELLKLAQSRCRLENVSFHQHDLTATAALPFKADVTFCINAMIAPDHTLRTALARKVRMTTKPNGISIFVVPAFESVLHVYKTMVRYEANEGRRREKASKAMEKLFEEEVASCIEGIVSIGGTLTKCYTQEELHGFLSDSGFEVEEIRKIEFSWDEEIDNAPAWLKGPYPYDWLARARRRK